MDAFGNDYPRTDIEAIVKAMGVESISVVNAYEYEESVEALGKALAYEGPAVVILQGECQLQRQRREKKGVTKTFVDSENCDGCKSCVQLGCPGIKFDVKKNQSSIDTVLCVDCGLCRQVCPSHVIKQRRR